MSVIDTLIHRHPELKPVESSVRRASDAVTHAFKRGSQLLLCGNGGSAADSDHIAGEFLKGFMSKRPLSKTEKNVLIRKFGKTGRYIAERLQKGFPAIPLTGFSALNTAFSNDVAPELMFAQMVNAIGRKGDILLGISTSGNADNVCLAAMTAKARGLTVIALTGKGGGKLKQYADIVIDAPGKETPDVQEFHLPIYHAICRDVEARLVK